MTTIFDHFLRKWTNFQTVNHWLTNRQPNVSQSGQCTYNISKKTPHRCVSLHDDPWLVTDSMSEHPMGCKLSEYGPKTRWVSFLWVTDSVSVLWITYSMGVLLITYSVSFLLDHILSEFPLGHLLSEWVFCGEVPLLSLSVGRTQRTWETRPPPVQQTSWHPPASAVSDKCSAEVSPSPKGWEKEPATRKKPEHAVIVCSTQDFKYSFKLQEALCSWSKSWKMITRLMQTNNAVIHVFIPVNCLGPF